MIDYQICQIFNFLQQNLSWILDKMYSLNQIEQNLKMLLKQMRGIQQLISQPQNRKKYNSQTMLLKIPKGILLISICKYLTMQQINYLSSTCSGMRKSIYSPLGWKVIMRLKTPYPIILKNQQSDLKIKMKSTNPLETIIQSHLDDCEDQKVISQERIKYKNILIAQYNSYLNSKQKHEAYKDKIKSEKGALFKLKQQAKYLDAVRQQLDDQNKYNKQKLKSLSQGFSNKIQQMDNQNDQLMKQRTKLQNQKQALASKVRQYQQEIQAIKEDSEKSKQILKRLKNYLLYKQL